MTRTGKFLLISSAIAALAAITATTGIAGSGGSASKLPQGDEPVDLDPADFTTQIDNPYWPMAPGNRWVYRETEDDEVQKIEVEVLEKTKTLANGIEARIVRDVVTDKSTGEPVEKTKDWFAQDSDGNIWYMGEKSREFKKGRFHSFAGSWEAGVDGAMAGVIMPAEPEVGMEYRQEYYAGEAEDEGEILTLEDQVEVSAGHFTDVVTTRDSNPLEPEVWEHKFYARDVGPVLELGISGGAARVDLLRYSVAD